MDNDLQHTKQIRSEYSTDMTKFLQFVAIYNDIHHEKEKLLYHNAKLLYELEGPKDVDYAMICNLDEEHEDIGELYRLVTHKFTIDDGYNGHEADFVTNVSIPSTNLIDTLFNHIEWEDVVVYPKVSDKIPQQQMEELSNELDEFDKKNKGVVNAMEFLSDELVQKYK